MYKYYTVCNKKKNIARPSCAKFKYIFKDKNLYKLLMVTKHLQGIAYTRLQLEEIPYLWTTWLKQFDYLLRDAIIKENPVKSGFLQIRGTTRSRFFTCRSKCKSRFLGGGFRIWNNRIKRF